MTRADESRVTTDTLGIPTTVRPPAIEVVSDVVRQWCYIGKRRLEKALVLLNRKDVAIRWRPFQLNPRAPKEGMDRQAYRIRKFGRVAYSQELGAQGGCRRR